jgi:glycosyltransferase involved in cell wall biosynthesis
MTKARTDQPSPGMDTIAGNEIQDALSLVSREVTAGNFDSAAALIRDAIVRAPDSVELLTAAALLSVRSGDHAGAESYLLKALRISPSNKDVIHDLALLYWSREQLVETRAMLQRLVDVDPGDADSLNDLGVFEDHCGNVGEATTAFKAAVILPGATRKTFENCLDFFLRHASVTEFRSVMGTYLSRYGEDDVSAKWQAQAAQSFTVVTGPTPAVVNVAPPRVRGKKIAFFAAYQTFLDPIMKDLQSENEVRLFAGGSEAQMNEMLEWCDVAWFEWCDNFVIAASKMPKRCKIICRLHSYEAFTEMPQQVDWSRIDHLVLVNKSVQELLARSVEVPTPMSIIHNGVDTEKFSIPAAKTLGKRICSIGYINYKKNPALLLYCFKAIHDHDKSYRFHIAGAHQDPRIQVYFEHLLPRLGIPISFDGWVDDVPGYLRDKDFVISTSLFESFHYSIAEGMASGVLPLIHDWLGASYLYPEEYLFTTPEDCVTLIRRLESLDRRQAGAACRKFIVSHYDQKQQLAKINALISAVTEGK